MLISSSTFFGSVFDVVDFFGDVVADGDDDDDDDDDDDVVDFTDSRAACCSKM